jgi:transposase-like protein
MITDGLTGFPGAIASIYPDTEVQLRIVHQIRNSLRLCGLEKSKGDHAQPGARVPGYVTR